MSESPASAIQSRDVRPRRTQVARSAETRARLLDATIASLVEAGYASTTTTAVCERAGVSRGAQVHHFPRKQDLVVAAVAHLAARRAAELRRRAEALPAAGGADRLEALLELVTEAFGGPLFDAALELWVAARTDAELHRSLYLFERVAGRGLASLWREVAGDLASADRFDAVLQLTMHLARGMALQKILRSDDTDRRRLLQLWREMASRALRGRSETPAGE
jgi:AcrR family transcriptional regulator